MTDKEKLDAVRAEIHRLVDVRGYDKEMANDLFAFMDSLPNEPVSENLEEAANFYADTHTEWFDADNNPHVSPAFKAGAKWQKEQMMAKAIDAQCFGFQGAALFSFRLPADKYLVGSKVKVIVIKEN
jgi:hypothetical protein